MNTTTATSRCIAYLLLVGCVLLAGCYQMGAGAPPSPVNVRIPAATPMGAPTGAPSTEPTIHPSGLYDAMGVMQGICFEAALDAAGRVFVLRSAQEHIDLYDLADHSELCRRPVRRYPFDFTGGDVLAGLWTAGLGCQARHDIQSVVRDDAAKTITIRLRFVTTGECSYELVRPFWVGIPDAQDYEIDIQVERAPA